MLPLANLGYEYPKIMKMNIYCKIKHLTHYYFFNLFPKNHKIIDVTYYIANSAIYKHLFNRAFLVKKITQYILKT